MKHLGSPLAPERAIAWGFRGMTTMTKRQTDALTNLVLGARECLAAGMTEYELYCGFMKANDEVRGTTMLDVDVVWRKQCKKAGPGLEDLSWVTLGAAREAVADTEEADQAVKALRERTGLGLKLAKEAIRIAHEEAGL